MKNKRKIIGLVALFLLIIQNQMMGQFSIVSTQFNSFNVTPVSLCAISVLNSQSEAQVVIHAKLINSSNEVLISVQTQPLVLNSGMNVLNSSRIVVQNVVYGTSAIANQIRTMGVLPSGTFQYCCAVVGFSTEGGDELCEDVDSELLSSLFLVSPDDKDTLDNFNPILLWSHSESFNMLASGEYFRLIVVELNGNQSADNAVAVNNPIFIKNNLNTHSIVYPIDAPKLEKGKRYGWQVQKLNNGNLKNQTEAWEFVVRKEVEINDYHDYAVLKKVLDANYYIPENYKIYFKFDEDYNGGDFICVIYNSKREKVLPIVKNEDKKLEISKKKFGFNYFEIDLSELSDLTKGYYTLEVLTEKNEVFKLKFFVE